MFYTESHSQSIFYFFLCGIAGLFVWCTRDQFLCKDVLRFCYIQAAINQNSHISCKISSFGPFPLPCGHIRNDLVITAGFCWRSLYLGQVK